MANRVAAAAGRIAAAVALAAAVAGAQQAAPTSAPAPTKAPKGWWRQPKVVSQLELTAAQQAAIDAAESSHRAARSAATKVYSRAYAGLMAALSADPVDQASLEAQRRTFLAAWGELGKASADRLVALRGILSARQLEQLPKVAPGALRSGPVAVRALGEVGAAAPAAQP
jgi:Spy/CpxP family protein refolding chaperone